MFFVILAAFVVVLLGALWLWQRRHPGRIDMHANPEAAKLRERAADESARTRMGNHTGGPGGFPGGL